MSSSAVLEVRLEAFLAARGATRDMLLAAANQSFEAPLLVVATGSVLQGMGNERSDLDLNIVVDRIVTRLPIASYAKNALVDATFFSAEEIKDWPNALNCRPWPEAGPLTREEWRLRRARLRYGARFGIGLVLASIGDWGAWAARFRESWLAEAIAEWWRIEALRRSLAARWLQEDKPRLAAQRRLEAALAALESHAAAAGQLYLGPKWLSEKLRALADERALEELRCIMRLPTSEREVQSHQRRCEAVLTELNIWRDDRLEAQLFYLPGVDVRTIDGQTLASRWSRRGIEFQGTVPSTTKSTSPIWTGRLDEAPPPEVKALFVGDMTWLSIAARPN